MRNTKRFKKIENSPLIIEQTSFHIIDSDYIIIETAGVKVPIINIRREDVIGKKISEVYPKEYANFFIDLLNIVRDSKKDFHIVLNITNKIYEVSIIPILSRSNEIFGYIYCKTPYANIEFLNRNKTKETPYFALESKSDT